MRKILLLLMVSIAALTLATGCSEGETTDNPISKQGTLRASTEQQTRTALDGVNVVWSTDNKIAVLSLSDTQTILPYTLSSGAGTTDGQFTGTAFPGEQTLYAFYPYDASIRYAADAFNFTIPATQSFTQGSFANNALPMVGKGSANKLSFKNLMGVVVFKAIDTQTETSRTVESLTVTTAGEKIAGAASVAMNYTEAPVLAMAPNGTTSITLTGVNKILSFTPTEFYIALPAGEYAAGLTFTLKDAQGAEIWSKTTTKAMRVNRSKLAPLMATASSLFFPDAEFRKYLVEQKQFALTANKADIDVTNAANIEKFGTLTEINCKNKSIASLKGIEHFKALQTLYCSGNQLTSLDVSNNTALTHLYCHMNKLVSLDVSKTKLTFLQCNANHLSTLVINKELKTLECHSNELKTLDVSKNEMLTDLGCDHNYLPTLDVSLNGNLRSLLCYNNQLKELDVSHNTALTVLYCYGNRMSTLDIWGNNNLKKGDLYCGKQTDGTTTARPLTLLCTQTQHDAGFGTDTRTETEKVNYNDNVIPTVKQ
ncbi:MAG: leucine-rich repeat domain-containing protein [Alistipes sp.]